MPAAKRGLWGSGSDTAATASTSTVVARVIRPISISDTRPWSLMSSVVPDSMTVVLEMIFSKDDVSFCVDHFEETERKRVFLDETLERRLVKRAPIRPAFFKSGA